MKTHPFLGKHMMKTDQFGCHIPISIIPRGYVLPGGRFARSSKQHQGHHTNCLLTYIRVLINKDEAATYRNIINDSSEDYKQRRSILPDKSRDHDYVRSVWTNLK